jgi:hypothetical protein
LNKFQTHDGTKGWGWKLRILILSDIITISVDLNLYVFYAYFEKVVGRGNKDGKRWNLSDFRKTKCNLETYNWGRNGKSKLTSTYFLNFDCYCTINFNFEKETFWIICKFLLPIPLLERMNNKEENGVSRQLNWQWVCCFI